MPALLVAPQVKLSILILESTVARKLTKELCSFTDAHLEGPSTLVLPPGGGHHTHTLLLLTTHHREQSCERRYDDQRHSDGNSSDGPSPRGVHWEISKGRLLNLNSIAASKRFFFSFSNISHITGSRTPRPPFSSTGLVI